MIDKDIKSFIIKMDVSIKNAMKHLDQTKVIKIAKITAKEMSLRDVKLKFSGGVEGGRGWVGDVKNMLLDVGRLKALGWKPKLSSEGAIRRATNLLIKELTF